VRWQLLQIEVNFPKSLHIDSSDLGKAQYHNAAAADDDGRRIDCEAIFLDPSGKEITVPVFAALDPDPDPDLEFVGTGKGKWRWLLRFRPPASGSWKVTVKARVSHPIRVDASDTEKLKQKEPDGLTYYEHKAESVPLSFDVSPGNAPGPLELPAESDNAAYFHRTYQKDGTFGRQPFFLYGMCRPWSVDVPGWDSYVDREQDLFPGLQKAGFNVLYHWLAPWDTMLMHQSTEESEVTGWKGGPLQPKGGSKQEKQLAGTDKSLGYKRFDQTRARRVDALLTLAERFNVLVFMVLLPHPSIRSSKNKSGVSRWDWTSGPDSPGQYNGFALFDSISTTDFFKASASGGTPASRRLWRHFVNYLRYVVARWGSHPGLGAWVVVDEIEDVGDKKESWGTTETEWHDQVLKLLRDNSFGNYLKHPVTSSAARYEWPYSKTALSAQDTAALLANTKERAGFGNFKGGTQAPDFYAHHVYPAVPSFKPPPKPNDPLPTWHAINDGTDKATGVNHADRIGNSRWSWDALCQRLSSWSRCFGPMPGKPQLVTEYGAYERDDPVNNVPQKWNQYGERMPALAHFASWAAFSLGLAGIPFKWNDREFGEMQGRPRWLPDGKAKDSPVWNPQAPQGSTAPLYPVDVYTEVSRLQAFLGDRGNRLDLTVLRERIASQPQGGGTGQRSAEVRDLTGQKKVGSFSVFALCSVNEDLVVGWLYNREFNSAGRPPPDARLTIQLTGSGGDYECRFFDTWSGKYLAPTGVPRPVSTNGSKQLLIPLPAAFPKTADKTVATGADGNDIAFYLKRVAAQAGGDDPASAVAGAASAVHSIEPRTQRDVPPIGQRIT